jgi:hypothetical protein
MSRLRRLVLSDHWFFITCRVLPRRRHLSDSEFATLAQVIAERRRARLHGSVQRPVAAPTGVVVAAYCCPPMKGLAYHLMAKKSRRGTQKAVE